VPGPAEPGQHGRDGRPPTGQGPALHLVRWTESAVGDVGAEIACGRSARSSTDAVAVAASGQRPEDRHFSGKRPLRGCPASVPPSRARRPRMMEITRRPGRSRRRDSRSSGGSRLPAAPTTPRCRGHFRVHQPERRDSDVLAVTSARPAKAKAKRRRPLSRR
jgi:hypothetical protein